MLARDALRIKPYAKSEIGGFMATERLTSRKMQALSSAFHSCPKSSVRRNLMTLRQDFSVYRYLKIVELFPRLLHVVVGGFSTVSAISAFHIET
jgi:hypothetical protein